MSRLANRLQKTIQDGLEEYYARRQWITQVRCCDPSLELSEVRRDWDRYGRLTADDYFRVVSKGLGADA